VKKRLFYVVLLLAAAGAAYHHFYAVGDTHVKGAVTLAPVRRGPLVRTVQSIGTLQPTRFVRVGSQVSGEVKALYVDFNSVVTKDQVLAEIDPTLYETQVAVQKANIARQDSDLASQRVQLGNDQKNLERAQASYDRGLISLQQLENVQLQVKTRAAQIAAGEKTAVSIALVALPDAKVIPAPGRGTGGGGGDDGIRAELPDDAPRSRLGVMAMVHVDAPNAGGAALLGLTVDVLPRLELAGAAIVGPYYGGYLGATFKILEGTFRPFVAAGMPVFASDGARFAVRGAGGLEIALNRHIALIAEIGVEYLLNPEADISATAFIPAVGASARL
jgi:hypothetical protein